MKKSVIVLLVAILLIFPLVQAQTYSGLNRFTDDVKLVFSGGDNKVRLALEIREKEIDSAMENFQNQDEEDAIKNLERAKKKLQIVQEKVSLETSEEIQTSVDEIIDKINEEDDLPDEFDDYILEEEKTQLTAELTEKTFEYCTELAKEDFALMLKEKECNPDTAPSGLEKELEKLKDLQYKMFVQLMLEIRSCIDDPGTCNCEANLEDSEKAKCEKMVALAVKCEYKEDETSCVELEAMKPEPGDSFARSFVPDFLMNLFAEKHEMIEYDIQPSDNVPEECQNYNTKPECRQYDDLKENNLDWDEYGNYRPIIINPDKKPSTGGIDEPRPPTIQEAFPECFDEKGMYLEECGNINVVWAEDGSVNYIIEKEIDGIIDDFENKSAQRRYAPGTSANGTEGPIGEEIWTVDEGEWTVSNKAREIKKDMNQIQNQIVARTYAPGTGPGEPGVVDGDGGVVVDNGDDGGDDFDGYITPEVGRAAGDDGASGGDDSDDVVGTDIAGNGDDVIDPGTVDQGDSGTEDPSDDTTTVDDGSGEPDVVDE